MGVSSIKNAVFSETDEAQLIRALQAADAKAQDQFYRFYFGKMFGIAYRYASNREDAYEIINTAFFKVFTAINNYQEIGSFPGWVATIVRRTAQDHCKQYQFKRQIPADWRAPDAYVYNMALSNLATEELFDLIQQLPPASRTVFNLFVIDGHSHKEIADDLQISVGTSKWHLANARKIMIQLLHKENR